MALLRDNNVAKTFIESDLRDPVFFSYSLNHFFISILHADKNEPSNFAIKTGAIPEQLHFKNIQHLFVTV